MLNNSGMFNMGKSLLLQFLFYHIPYSAWSTKDLHFFPHHFQRGINTQNNNLSTEKSPYNNPL